MNEGAAPAGAKTSLFTRPFILLCVAMFLVPLLVMVFAGGIVRGLGWAGLNIGGYTTLAMAAPVQRRGEAAGYYTSATASASIGVKKGPGSILRGT